MPFELGLAVAWAKLNRVSHTWFVCETKSRRALKSVSDLNGTDLQIHGGTAPGIMGELCSAFVGLAGNHPFPTDGSFEFDF